MKKTIVVTGDYPRSLFHEYFGDRVEIKLEVETGGEEIKVSVLSITEIPEDEVE